MNHRILAVMPPRLTSIRATFQALVGVAIAAALLLQFTHGLQLTSDVIPYIEQFFSYFTILTNIFVAAVFLYETFARNKAHSSRFESVRGAAVFCAVLTGVTYALFLRGPGGFGQVAYSIYWVNAVFHYVMPAAIFLDWLAFPPRNRINWSTMFSWIGITIVYAILVELGGAFSHLYPYFFLDPTRFGGYYGVFRASAGWMPFFLVFSIVLIGTANSQRWIRQRKKRSAKGTA